MPWGEIEGTPPPEAKGGQGRAVLQKPRGAGRKEFMPEKSGPGLATLALEGLVQCLWVCACGPGLGKARGSSFTQLSCGAKPRRGRLLEWVMRPRKSILG